MYCIAPHPSRASRYGFRILLWYSRVRLDGLSGVVELIPGGIQILRASILLYRSFWGLVIAAAIAGCASTPDRRTADGESSYQFDPIPIPVIDEQELSPGPNAVRLLDEATQAFEAANQAHKAGDNETAYQQYNIMMELLLESDVDPSVFYELRDEFNRILSETTKIARSYESETKPLSKEEIGRLALRSELEYPNPLNDRVLAEIRHIQQTYPRGFQAGLNRSAKYMPFIREEFRRAGLPEDLVWLAMVESQFTPRINSRVGAGGMWQFMPSTGRRYGLERDHYIDERYDWKKSTRASIQYLSELYEMFDSWPLAVSAYNMGEGGIERAIARNDGERDLWKLLDNPPASTRIPRETKKFYAKLLASAMIAKDPERYGFTYDPLPPDETTAIEITGAYMISDLEKAAGLTLGSLQDLNTQFLYGYTPPNRTTHLYVPKTKMASVSTALTSLPKMRPDTHVVRRGETLSGIAALYGVSANELMTTNNIRSARRLQINQRLVIPGRMGSNSVVQAAASEGGRKVHTVSRGDSLSRIASRNGVTVKQIQTWNNMGRNTRIHINDRLYVSDPGAIPSTSLTQTVSSPPPSAKPEYYTVRRGDYPGKIARDQGVKLNELLAWNNLTSRSVIRVGDRLKVYKSGGSSTQLASAPSSTSPVTHTVKSGETPGSIAQKYGTSVSNVLNWNGLRKSSIIHIGDVLVVGHSNSTSTNNSSPSAITHVVARGDSPSMIAQKYSVSLRDLYAWNNWTRDPVLQIGQRVTIRR